MRCARVRPMRRPCRRPGIDRARKSNSIPNAISRYSACLRRPRFAGAHRHATSACRPSDFTTGPRCRRSHSSHTTTSRFVGATRVGARAYRNRRASARSVDARACARGDRARHMRSAIRWCPAHHAASWPHRRTSGHPVGGDERRRVEASARDRTAGMYASWRRRMLRTTTRRRTYRFIRIFPGIPGDRMQARTAHVARQRYRS